MSPQEDRRQGLVLAPQKERSPEGPLEERGEAQHVALVQAAMENKKRLALRPRGGDVTAREAFTDCDARSEITTLYSEVAARSMT